MARVHEKTEFSVSVIGCGRMGCAIAGRAPLRSVKGMGGGRPGDYGGKGVREVGGEGEGEGEAEGEDEGGGSGRARARGRS